MKGVNINDMVTDSKGNQYRVTFIGNNQHKYEKIFKGGNEMKQLNETIKSDLQHNPNDWVRTVLPNDSLLDNGAECTLECFDSPQVVWYHNIEKHELTRVDKINSEKHYNAKTWHDIPDHLNFNKWFFNH